MARHTASSHGVPPILIHTWFSHLHASASICAQYPNEYPNMALPSSVAECVNFAAVLDLAAAAAATLVPAVASDCCAAAAAAAVAARHACCGGVSFFFLNKADVSSTDIAPHVSGRSPQTLRNDLQRRLRYFKDTSKTSGRQLIWLDVLQTEIVRVQSRIARVIAHQRVSAFAVLPILRHGRGLPAVFAAKLRRRMQLWAKTYSSSSSRGS